MVQTVLQARVPRAVPAGLAGYGYEVMLITEDEATDWPLHFLNWIVPLEILHDVNLLSRVNDLAAITGEMDME